MIANIVFNNITHLEATLDFCILLVFVCVVSCSILFLYPFVFSLLLRFVNDTFDPEQSATIGT